jgi:phosphatidate cytidylyltransferase
LLRTRLLTAAVALPALWLIIQHLWSPLFTAFILLVVTVGLVEYFGMAFPDRVGDRVAGVALGLVAACGVFAGATWTGAALTVVIVLGLARTLAEGSELPAAMQRLGVIVLGVLYVGFVPPHITLLREMSADGWRWVLFTVYVAMGSDSGAYFAGRAFGQRKLLPSVSPSKTVEGALGGLGGAVVIAVASHLVFLKEPALVEIVGLALAISVLAQVGDLCESALKRAFGAKDSGWIIPGHGGILDRLDSLVFPFVFAYYYVALTRG